MTNRKSLAIIIPMLLVTSNGINAAEIFNKNGNTLQLYGSVNPNYKLSHGFLSTIITSNSDDTNAVVGLSSTININDELLSYAVIEYQTNFVHPERLLNTQQSNAVRLGYAGFKYGNWGSIDYGRNYGIFNDVQSLTNHVPYINKDSFLNNNDHYMIGRNNNLLTYRNDNVFGLLDGVSFAVQYQNEIKNPLHKKRSGEVWGASLKYKTNIGFTAVGSVFSSPNLQLNKDDKNNKSNNIGAYGLGVKYNTNDIYVAAFYGEARNLIPHDMINLPVVTNDNNNQANTQSYVNTTQNIEAIAEYDFHSGFYSTLSYVDSKEQKSGVSQDGAHDNNIKLSKQINISTRYEFNKNISTYMNYKINLLKNDNIDKNQNNSTGDTTGNTIGAGIVYQF